MQYSNFDSIGRSISKLGFGLMRLPKKEENSEIIDRDEAFRLIDLAMKSGVNYYDTAYFYHGGDSEQFVKEALSRYPAKAFVLQQSFQAVLLKIKRKTPKKFSMVSLKNAVLIISTFIFFTQSAKIICGYLRKTNLTITS